MCASNHVLEDHLLTPMPTLPRVDRSFGPTRPIAVGSMICALSCVLLGESCLLLVYTRISCLWQSPGRLRLRDQAHSVSSPHRATAVPCPQRPNHDTGVPTHNHTNTQANHLLGLNHETQCQCPPRLLQSPHRQRTRTALGQLPGASRNGNDNDNHEPREQESTRTRRRSRSNAPTPTKL